MDIITLVEDLIEKTKTYYVGKQENWKDKYGRDYSYGENHYWMEFLNAKKKLLQYSSMNIIPSEDAWQQAYLNNAEKAIHDVSKYHEKGADRVYLMNNIEVSYEDACKIELAMETNSK